MPSKVLRLLAITSGAMAARWFADDSIAPEIEAMAETVKAVVMAFVCARLGAPHWRPEARGILAGLTRDTHKGHIARAVLEGIALQNRDILVAMQEDAGALSSLKVDGGALCE